MYRITDITILSVILEADVPFPCFSTYVLDGSIGGILSAKTGIFLGPANCVFHNPSPLRWHMP